MDDDELVSGRHHQGAAVSRLGVEIVDDGTGAGQQGREGPGRVARGG